MAGKTKNKRVVTLMVAGAVTIEWILLRQTDTQQHTAIKADHLSEGRCRVIDLYDTAPTIHTGLVIEFTASGLA